MPPQVQLPPGYEDARAVQTAAPPRANSDVSLPAGYEDAKPAQPPLPPRSTSAPLQITGIGAQSKEPMDEAHRLRYYLQTGEEPPNRLENWLSESANYTQEGRREHPVRAFVGDTYKRLQDYGRLVAPTLALLSGPEGEAAAGIRLKPINQVSKEPFSLTAPHAETEPAIQERLRFPEPESTNATATQRSAPEGERLQPIGKGNGNGYKPSEKVATMSAERRNLGPEFQAGEVSHEIERNRNILRNPNATAEDVQVAQSRLDELGANRLQPIGRARSPRGYTNLGRSEPVKLEDVVNQATGVKPLKADVPLNEQFTKTTAAETPAVDPIKAKYPDPKVRQMVRANGEQIYEAAKHNPATVQAIHDLTRVELRQALINSGEDMGQVTVSNSKFAGQGSIPREEAFNRLLRKNLSPERIVQLAKQIPGETKVESLLPEEKTSTSISTLPTKRAMRERASRIRAARLQ